MMVPVCSLGQDSKADVFVAIASTDEGKGISEIGLRFVPFVIVSSAYGTTHATPDGGGWERGSKRRSRDGFDDRDVGAMTPVHPDELGQGEEVVFGSVFFFPVSEAWASSVSVVGIGGWIASESLKDGAFLIEIEGAR